jgi:hypothetical protein
MMKTLLGIAVIFLSLSPLPGKAQEQTLSIEKGLLQHILLIQAAK